MKRCYERGCAEVGEDVTIVCVAACSPEFGDAVVVLVESLFKIENILDLRIDVIEEFFFASP